MCDLGVECAKGDSAYVLLPVRGGKVQSEDGFVQCRVETTELNFIPCIADFTKGQSIEAHDELGEKENTPHSPQASWTLAFTTKNPPIANN